MDGKCFLKTSLVAAAATVASVAGAGRTFLACAQRAGRNRELDEIVGVVVVEEAASQRSCAMATPRKPAARPYCLEKMDQLGGTSRVSRLDFACAGSDEQAAEGIEDDRNPALPGYEEGGRRLHGDPELARTVASRNRRILIPHRARRRLQAVQERRRSRRQTHTVGGRRTFPLDPSAPMPRRTSLTPSRRERAARWTTSSC